MDRYNVHPRNDLGDQRNSFGDQQSLPKLADEIITHKTLEKPKFLKRSNLSSVYLKHLWLAGTVNPITRTLTPHSNIERPKEYRRDFFTAEPKFSIATNGLVGSGAGGFTPAWKHGSTLLLALTIFSTALDLFLLILK